MNKPIVDLDKILTLAPIHIYWLDRENVYQGCNDSQAIRAGLKSKEEIVGKQNKDLPWYANRPEFIDRMNQTNLEIMESGKSLMLEEPGTLSDGSKVNYLSYKMPLFNEDKSQVVGLLGISIDISERTRKTDELLAQKEYAELTLEQIIANMPSHVYWKNLEGVYLGCNDKQAKSLGFDNGRDVIGKTDFDLPWRGKNAELFRENDLEVINTAKPIVTEETSIVDNRNAVVLSHKVPLRDKQNNIMGVLGISMDITDLKNYQEKLKKANQSKSDFLAIMVHELIAPVSNIINSLDIIKKMTSGEKLEDENTHIYLELARKEASQIIPKLNEVVEYINFDSDKLALKKSPCNIIDLVNKIIDKNHINKMNSVIINLKPTQKIPSRIILDPEHLYNVLNILIGNAVRFTKKGQIDISITNILGNSDLSGLLEITVKDTGPGIHAEQLKWIQNSSLESKDDEFARYRKPSIRLCYAKLLVCQILCGELIIDSSLGSGTTATIRIPYEEVSEETDTPASSNKATYNVLLVEDNESSRNLEETMLKTLDCNVESVGTGQEAIEHAEQKIYDLIFLDITLPDMNGIKVFDNLKKTLCKNTPVIALTSHSSEEDIDLFINKGMLTVLAKPISSESLKEFFVGFRQSLEI